MDTASAADIVAAIPVGVIIEWIALITGIITAVCFGTIKIYKVFDRYNTLKEEKDDLLSTVNAHEAKFQDVDKKLSLIIDKLESQDVTTMKKLRRELVKDGERYIVDKKMTIREWKSWMEMFEEYSVKFNQNSYVETLRNKIEREVTVIGKLDEHGNDVA